MSLKSLENLLMLPKSIKIILEVIGWSLLLKGIVSYQQFPEGRRTTSPELIVKPPDDDVTGRCRKVTGRLRNLCRKAVEDSRMVD